MHRDLKRGNVMLTPAGAKVLDFGLAKESARALVDIETQAPTLASPLTSEGLLVGTLPYMAPEQLEGKPADQRTDLWALGCLLYEMATGARPFRGETQASLITAIMAARPEPVSGRQPVAPRRFEHVVGRCLEKDPERRWQSARDVAIELEDLAREIVSPEIVSEPRLPRPATSPRPRWMPAMAAAVLLAIASGAVWLATRYEPRPDQQAHFAAGKDETWTVTSLDLEATAGYLALSPDGRSVVLSRRSGETSMRSRAQTALYRRSLDSRVETLITGSDGAEAWPSFSPDGRQLAWAAWSG